MKALVATAPERLVMRALPVPAPGADEALVRIISAGICGSDLHAYLGHDARRPMPLILGHEGAGVIAAGSDAGRRVSINPLVSCRQCANCTSGRENLCAQRQILSMPPRPGVFAQYACAPARNLITIPDTVSFDAASLIEPFACSRHAIRLGTTRRGDDPGGLRCLVLGGGAIGLGAALTLASMDAREIHLGEINDARRRVLTHMQRFEVMNPRTDSIDGMDLVIDAVGHRDTRAYACRALKPGGVLVHIGLAQATGGLDVRRMTLQEITFIGTYTYTRKDFKQTARALFDGHLGPLDWLDVRPLSDGARAFADMHHARAAAPKIILRPPDISAPEPLTRGPADPNLQGDRHG